MEVLGCLREMYHDAFEAVCAVGYSGQMPGLDADRDDGYPVRPAIIWLDQRAGRQLEQISAVLPEEERDGHSATASAADLPFRHCCG